MKFLIILFPLFTNAQTINVAGGLNNQKPMFQIEAGYENKIVLMGSYEAIPVREAKSVNFYYGLKAGYEIKNFIPQIGYFFSHRGFKGLAYFLKYGINIGDNGVFIEAGYLEKIQVTGGFAINIK